VTTFSSNISSIQDSLSAKATSVLNKINPFETSSSGATTVASIAEQRRSTKKQKSFISKLEFNSISTSLFGGNIINPEKSFETENEETSRISNQNNESLEMLAQSGIDIESKKSPGQVAEFSQNGSSKMNFI
jgi:hypothetical protein